MIGESRRSTQVSQPSRRLRRIVQRIRTRCVEGRRFDEANAAIDRVHLHAAPSRRPTEGKATTVGAVSETSRVNENVNLCVTSSSKCDSGVPEARPRNRLRTRVPHSAPSRRHAVAVSDRSRTRT